MALSNSLRSSVRRACVGALAASLLLAGRARAKNPEQPETAPRPDEQATFLDHSPEAFGPFWVGGEVNSILQHHGDFHSPRMSDNSLQGQSESALSGLITLFLGYLPLPTTELIVDPEMALGGGLSKSLGLAGFSNLDVVRNPTLPHTPYIARAEIHQIIPLSKEWVPNEDRGPISSMPLVPLHRLELRVGKMSTADLFDINPAGSDSHLQFMNWAVDNNGAFDYAADTRGYTYGFVVEYQGPFIEARFGEMLMPKEANGPVLDWDLANSRGENLELEIKYSLRPDWRGTVRLLGYQNHANMGSYAEAIAAFDNGVDATPNIIAHRKKGRGKQGVGLNVIQQLGPLVRAFGRAGWSGGDYESFAYTEIENTVELGADVTGDKWRRPTDRVGLAFVTNGISSLHAEYLSLGGSGFILGDGYLRYARERIFEQYYNLHVWRGAFLAEDIQFVTNPGYNSDRGPVWIFSARAHLEF